MCWCESKTQNPNKRTGLHILRSERKRSSVRNIQPTVQTLRDSLHRLRGKFAAGHTTTGQRRERGRMKILHKFKAWSLRRQLVRQRAQNIADIRAGRTLARVLKIRLAREIRLAGALECARSEARLPDVCLFREKGITTAPAPSKGQISAIVRKMPKLERRAA